MKEMGSSQQLRTGEVLIIVVVLFMWAGECLPSMPHLASAERKSQARPLLSQKQRQLRCDGSLEVLLWGPDGTHSLAYLSGEA